MGNAEKVYGVSYGTIDGKRCKPANLYGYCKAHKGMLTYPLAQLHRCNCRKDGEPCMHFIKFDRIDNTYQSELKGEEFRASLGKKGKNKGGRKERKTSDTVSKALGVSSESQADKSLGCMDEVGDLQAVSSDKRLEEDGVRDNFNKDRCSQCFWRKMFCRVVRVYVCAGRDGE